jgi:alpha-glucosidase
MDITTAQKFRERNIPADYDLSGYSLHGPLQVYTWDKERFRTEQTINQLKQLGFNLAVIIDPGVEGWNKAMKPNTMASKTTFCEVSDGSLLSGVRVWPGGAIFPTSLCPRPRTCWRLVKSYVNQGVTGFWNDMNEIAAWGKDVPKLLEFDWEGKKTSYSEAKNNLWIIDGSQDL